MDVFRQSPWGLIIAMVVNGIAVPTSFHQKESKVLRGRIFQDKVIEYELLYAVTNVMNLCG